MRNSDCLYSSNKINTSQSFKCAYPTQVLSLVSVHTSNTSGSETNVMFVLLLLGLTNDILDTVVLAETVRCNDVRCNKISCFKLDATKLTNLKINCKMIRLSWVRKKPSVSLCLRKKKRLRKKKKSAPYSFMDEVFFFFFSRHFSLNSMQEHYCLK